MTYLFLRTLMSWKSDPGPLRRTAFLISAEKHRLIDLNHDAYLRKDYATHVGNLAVRHGLGLLSSGNQDADKECLALARRACAIDCA